MAVDLKIRPQIFIYYSADSDQEDLQTILYGIEEEQVPYSIEKGMYSSATAAAYRAAQDSSLNVGIGFVNNEVALHYKNLPEDDPYQSIKRVGTCPKEILKSFGANAARLVKGIPFYELE